MTSTHNSATQEALLIVNLGSPRSPSTSDVRKYLQEFLMDPYVVDIPYLFRAMLVYGPISFSRAGQSAHAYQNIWDEQRGSPLIYHTEDFVKGLRNYLGDKYRIEMGMRYAEPSLKNSIQKLLSPSHPSKLTIALMYPQYALSSTQTAYDECLRVLKELNYKGETKFIQDFHSEPEWIHAFSSVAREHLPQSLDKDALVLMSFHGIPERHIKKLKDHPEGGCNTAEVDCTQEIKEANKSCYRAQCYSTARHLASSLKLKPEEYRVSFQSRLGRTPWLKPYTDHVLKDLVQEGFKKVYVMCPAFVTDCLETIEEIQIREYEAFKSYGGEDLKLIPCPNASDVWVQSFAEMLKRLT